MSLTTTEKKINELFEELVPGSGKADTVAGEIIRAVSRIGYRNYNDGDHIGVGYGNETCNPAARYLREACDKEVAECIDRMWGIYSDEDYKYCLDDLELAVLEFLEAHPDLKTKKNDTDMWSFRTDEDVDDSEEDDDDWY